MKKISIIASALLVLCSCGKEKEPLTVTPESLTMYYEGTAQLTTNAEAPTFSAPDEFYATVDANGLVKAGKVGKTKIIVSADNGVVDVPLTIIPAYDLYPDIDPYMGASMSQISSKFGTGYSTSTASGGGTMWTYTDYNKYSNIAFLFEGGKVTQALVALSTTYTSMLTSHLKERYTVAGMLNDYFFLLNHDKSVMIALTVYSNRLLAVLYTPYTESKAGATDIDISAFGGCFE